jgi:hypothetical protein
LVEIKVTAWAAGGTAIFWTTVFILEVAANKKAPAFAPGLTTMQRRAGILPCSLAGEGLGYRHRIYKKIDDIFDSEIFSICSLQCSVGVGATSTLLTLLNADRTIDVQGGGHFLVGQRGARLIERQPASLPLGQNSFVQGCRPAHQPTLINSASLGCQA